MGVSDCWKRSHMFPFLSIWVRSLGNWVLTVCDNYYRKLYMIVTMIRKLYKHMLVTEWRPAVVIDYWLLPPSSLLTYRKQTKKSCNNYVQEVIRSERKNTLKENTSKVEWKSESDLFGRFPQISSPWRENCTYYEMWTHEDPGPGTQYLFGSRGRKFVRASKPCFSTKM